MSLPLRGLAEIAGRCDGLIIDLWGVIHDGTRAFPAAIEALAALAAAGKPVLLLSNAPRRTAVLRGQLAALGVAPGLYHAILSSGEAVHLALRDRPEPLFATLGHRLFHLGPPGEDELFTGLDYHATTVDEADFILNSGPWQHGDTVEAWLPVLERGAARGLPMVCANPDQVVVFGGRRRVCAGALAARYAELGGRVELRGKPDPAIYDIALEMLGTPRGRTLCVGDGMATDIAGAAASGMDSVLVAGGIHAAELGAAPEAALVETLAARYGVSPTAWMPAFSW